MFSYARNSCHRNHNHYTLCAHHRNRREHEGDWKSVRAMPEQLYDRRLYLIKTSKCRLRRLPDIFRPAFYERRIKCIREAGKRLFSAAECTDRQNSAKAEEPTKNKKSNADNPTAIYINPFQLLLTLRCRDACLPPKGASILLGERKMEAASQRSLKQIYRQFKIKPFSLRGSGLEVKASTVPIPCIFHGGYG